MNDFVFINLGNGTVGLYERKSVFDGNTLRRLRDQINQIIEPTATEIPEAHTPSEDSSTASPDPVDSPPEA